MLGDLEEDVFAKVFHEPILTHDQGSCTVDTVESLARRRLPVDDCSAERLFGACAYSICRGDEEMAWD